MYKTQIYTLAIVLAVCFQVGSATWNNWGSWSTCSVTCGTGSTTRTRECPAGSSCSGDASESLSCVIMNYCIPSYYGNTDKSCGVDYFGCASGVTSCVNITTRCDGTQDCEDGSDENPYFTGCTITPCNTATHVAHSALMTLVLFAFTALLQRI